MALPESLAALLTGAAYPHPADHVQLIETPISWVLLAGDFAYKIKRPVHFAFIDLRDPTRRAQLCEEELRLNRRFAPELYLEVSRIVSQADGAHVGGGGPVLEHAVRMLRFPREEELDRLLEAGGIEPRELNDFGRVLAGIHAELPTAPAASSWGQPAQTQALMVRNLLECADAADALGLSQPVHALHERLLRRLPPAAAVMAARRTAGRVRECHGDLHCRNIVRRQGRLIAFDCLEYEPAFRWIDVADEVAFLASDLAARDRAAHAHAFVTGYLEESGDYQACRVLRLYEAHRALVRAKVAALSAASLPEGPQREALRREHVSLVAHAGHSLGTGSPALLLMQGLSGSGKTWLARQLAEALHAIHLRSDVERKRRAGLAALSRTQAPVAGGLYAGDTTEAVYEHLAAAAEDILAGGGTVIVDATFLRRGQRARFLALAARVRVPAHLVRCSAPRDVLEARITTRQAQGDDPSDAGTAVLTWQQERCEPLGPDEPFDLIAVDTTQPRALDAVLTALRS